MQGLGADSEMADRKNRGRRIAEPDDRACEGDQLEFAGSNVVVCSSFCARHELDLERRAEPLGRLALAIR